jgi:2-polyprenyl-6-methoxyphenol hydroxylase-like FAD-dependent oxidoreductase
MDIAIFGAGIAGIMTAIALHPQGHRCRIYERNRPGHESGMGFIMMPGGVDRLRSYGVTLDGIPLDRYYCRDSAGNVLLEQAMPPGTCSLRRSELVASMARVLADRAELSFGHELQGMEFDEQGAVVAARLQSGELIHADLYVAADGVGSRARQAIYPNWPVSPARVREIVGLVRCEIAIRWAGRNFNKFHSRQGGIAVGIVPVDAEHVVWYMQYDSHRFPPPALGNGLHSEACRAFVQKLVGEWPHPIPKLLLQTDFSRVYTSQPIDADLVPLFFKGNLVLTGDAAHPLSPFTSQGVSSAIADAVALARDLESHQDLAAALADYSSERREHCSPYLDQGRDLARRFLEPVNPGNAFLPLAQ